MSHPLGKFISFLLVKCLVCLVFMFEDTATAGAIKVQALGYTGFGGVVNMSENAGQPYQARPAQPLRIAAPGLGYTGLGDVVNMSENAGQPYQARPVQPLRIAAPGLGYTGLGDVVHMPENAGQPYHGRPVQALRIAAPSLGYTGFGSSSAGLYEHVNSQSPVNTGLAGGQPFNKERPELLGMAKPDLTTLPQLSAAGSTTRWGGSVVLSSQQVQPAGNGLCSASITYTVQNSGTAPVPAFTSMLLSSANQGQPSANQWAQLAQGAKQTKTEQILLRPGKNSLTLYLDQSGQLDELNKANNQVRLLVILNGTCNR